MLGRGTTVKHFYHLFTRVLSTNMPVLQTVGIMSTSLKGYILRGSVLSTELRIRRKGRLGASLSNGPFVPMLVVQVLTTNRGTNGISRVLSSITSSCSRRIRLRLSALASLVRPFLVIFLNKVVNAVMATVFLPVFDVNSLTNNWTTTRFRI